MSASSPNLSEYFEQSRATFESLAPVLKEFESKGQQAQADLESTLFQASQPIPYAVY